MVREEESRTKVWEAKVKKERGRRAWGWGGQWERAGRMGRWGGQEWGKGWGLGLRWRQALRRPINNLTKYISDTRRRPRLKRLKLHGTGRRGSQDTALAWLPQILLLYRKDLRGAFNAD